MDEGASLSEVRENGVPSRGQGPHRKGQFCHCHRRESSTDGTGPDRLGDLEVGL